MAKSTVHLPTNPSATFTVPEGWSRRASGSLIELAPPEGDVRLVIADVGPASDARSAVVAAWTAYRGKETHNFKLLTPTPARDGWDVYVQRRLGRVDLRYQALRRLRRSRARPLADRDALDLRRRRDRLAQLQLHAALAGQLRPRRPLRGPLGWFA